MRKINVFIFLLLVFFTACNREIVLRKETVVSAPFNKEKIEEGNYTLNLYKIDYPSGMEGKQKFYTNINLFFKRFYLEEKKIIFLVDREYYDDYHRLEKYSLLKEELLLDKAASTLLDYEIELLREIAPVKIEKYKDTVQEYLNLQVAYLMDFLGESNKFDKNYLYTEREKNVYVNKLKDIRRENFELIKSLDIDMVLEINNPYSASEKSSRYFTERDIILSTTSKFDSELNSIEIPIYIRNIEVEDVERIIKGQDFIDNNVIIIENDRFKGYLHKKSFIFFIGGQEEFREYADYGINFEVKKLGLEEMLGTQEEFVISDFTGGK